jgi:hypothetical protein
MILSRKLVTAVLVNILTDAVALIVNHFSLHLSAAEAAEVASYVGVAAGALAGFLVKEIPSL